MQVQLFRLGSTFHCRFYLLCLLENCKAMKLPQSGAKSILRRNCFLPLIAFIKLEDLEVQDSFSQWLFAVYSLSFLAKFVVKMTLEISARRIVFKSAKQTKDASKCANDAHATRSSFCFAHLWFSRGILFSSSALMLRGVYRWGCFMALIISNGACKTVKWKVLQNKLLLSKPMFQAVSFRRSFNWFHYFWYQISRCIFHQLVKRVRLPQKQRMVY